MVSKAAQELGKKGGMVKSENKAIAARKNASKPRGKWVTAFYYGVKGADDKMHVGMVMFESKFDLDLNRNYDRICDYITEDLQANKAALPWKELVEFGGEQRKVV